MSQYRTIDGKIIKNLFTEGVAYYIEKYEEYFCFFFMFEGKPEQFIISCNENVALRKFKERYPEYELIKFESSTD